MKYIAADDAEVAKDPNLDMGEMHDVIPATGIEIAVEAPKPESDGIDEEVQTFHASVRQPP